MSRDRLATLTQAVAGAVFFVAIASRFLIGAYADWLRFISPRAPDPAAGQTVYVKAVKGAFYVTSAQAWWAGMAPFILGIGALAAVIMYAMVRWKRSKGRPWADEPWPFRAISIAAIAAAALAAFVPDHLMAVLMTGSLHVPPEPPPGITVVP